MRDDPCNLVPDGQYRAYYIGFEKGTAYGQPRYFARFRIAEPGEHSDRLLIRFYNVPRRNFLPRSHNLWKDYVQVHGGRPPSRGLTPDRFLKGCEVLVETQTVTTQIENGRRIKLPEDCHYSKIKRLIRITAGCPPHMRVDKA